MKSGKIGPGALIRKMAVRSNVEAALKLAVNSLRSVDEFCDETELIFYRDQRRSSALVEKVTKRLRNHRRLHLKPFIAFSLPKNALLNRRAFQPVFEDQVLLHAVLRILTEVLDDLLIPEAFAYRREKVDIEKRLLEEYSRKSWPAFVSWQEEQAQRFSWVVRTDFTSFYDSLDHKLLVQAVNRILSYRRGNVLEELLLRILRFPYLKFSWGRVPSQRLWMESGIPVGPQVYAFLANVYVRELDLRMARLPGIAYGRYVDDVRIFGSTRKAVLAALAIFQENAALLKLNLNGSKTRLVFENDIPRLIRKLTAGGASLPVDEDGELYKAVKETLVHSPNKRHAGDLVDPELGQDQKVFSPAKTIANDSEAREYCNFLGSAVVAYGYNRERRLASRAYLDKLSVILREFPGRYRYAAWLLVQSAFLMPASHGRGGRYAGQMIMTVLEDTAVNPVIKYRLLRHLWRLLRGKYRQGVNLSALESWLRKYHQRLESCMVMLVKRREYIFLTQQALLVLVLLTGKKAALDFYRGELAVAGSGSERNLLRRLKVLPEEEKKIIYNEIIDIDQL